MCIRDSIGTYQVIHRDTTLGIPVKSDFINDIFESQDGNIWVASNSGFYTVDIHSKKFQTFLNDELLGKIATYRVISFTEDSKKRLWIATAGKGLYCLDRAKKTLGHFSKKDGMLDDICLDMMTDSKDNVYVSSFLGFNIIGPDGK